MKMNKTNLVYGVLLSVSIIFCSHLALRGNTVNLFASPDKRYVRSAKEAISVFPQSVEAIEAQVAVAFKKTQENIAAIIAVSSQDRTYKNTVNALSEARAPIRELAGILEPVDHVHPDKDMRDAARDQRTIVSQFIKENTELNRALYDAVIDYKTHKAASEKLSSEERYYLSELIESFKRSGVDKPDEVRIVIKDLSKKLQDVSNDFSVAIANSNAFITATEDELVGVSESFKKALKRDEKGNCIVPCDYPSSAEVMSHCSNTDVRKRFLHAFTNRGYPENRANLLRLAELRDQLAKAQGYKTFSDYELATSTMAKRVDTVEKFLNALAPKAKVKLEQEVTQLLSDVPAGVSATDKLYPWDTSYLMEYHRQKYYSIDDRKVAEYFPMESTIKGLFSIYETFLGLKFVEHSAVGAWHENVRLMEVQKDGVTRGYIFLDMHPRPFKYTHACFCPMIPAQRECDEKGNEVIRPMMGTIICNFPKATADAPSLLKYDDAITFFHEFGHALHDVMGATTIAETAGCGPVKIDFVEMPSQMFEEWLNDKEMLKKVTRHYQTGEPMPDDIFDKLLSLVTFDSGFFISRQLRYSELSLRLFMGASQNPDELEKELFNRYMPLTCAFAEENHSYANFGHLTEYSCRYYGYLWSRVFSLDLAEYVSERGLLNTMVGGAFGENVLGKGASQDPDEILKNFLGRKPRQDAFLKVYGLNK